MSLMLHEILCHSAPYAKTTAMPGTRSASVSDSGVILTTQVANAVVLPLLRSADRGATWTTVQTATGGFNAVVFDENGSDNALAIAGNGSGAVYRSSDGGLTWSIVLASMVAGGIPQNGSVFLRGNRAVAVASKNSGGNIFFYSSDGGLTWTQSGTNVPTVAGADNSKDIYMFPTGEALAVSDVASNVVIRRSADFGVTWPSNLGTAANRFSVYGNPLTGTAIAISNAVTTGLRSTDKGATWSSVTFPFTASRAGVFCQESTGRWFLLNSTSCDLYTSTDDGVTWSLLIPGDGTAPIGSSNLSVNSFGLGVFLTSTGFARVFQI